MGADPKKPNITLGSPGSVSKRSPFHSGASSTQMQVADSQDRSKNAVLPYTVSRSTNVLQRVLQPG
jgi:hypothetical protein